MILKKWIEGPELCKRWNINKHDLADLLNDGYIQSYFEDGSSIFPSDDCNFYEICDDVNTLTPAKPLTGSETEQLIFRLSDVEHYEVKYGLMPQRSLKKESAVKVRQAIHIELAKEQRLLNPKLTCQEVLKNITDKILNEKKAVSGSHKVNKYDIKPYAISEFKRITKNIKGLEFPPGKPGNPHRKNKK